MKISELLRKACIYAEIDREAFVAAYSHMPDDPVAVEAREFLRELRAYRKKRWGQTKLERLTDQAKETRVI
jgi:hypothetical protein